MTTTETIGQRLAEAFDLTDEDAAAITELVPHVQNPPIEVLKAEARLAAHRAKRSPVSAD